MVLAGASGCGGGGVEVIVDASARTVESGTARIALTTVIDGGVGESKQRIDASGLVEFGRQAMDLQMRMGLPQRGGSDVTSDGGVDMLVRSDGATTVARLVAWPEDRPWAALPGSDSDSQGLTSAHLGVQMEALSAGITDIEEVGAEVVRGHDTTHYRASVDLDEALSQASGQEREGLQEIAAQQAGRDLPLDVWVGAERIRRVSYTLDLASVPATPAPSSVASGDPSFQPEATPAVGRGGSVTLVAEYFDFGVPFVVAMPADVSVPLGGAAPEDSSAPAEPGG